MPPPAARAGPARSYLCSAARQPPRPRATDCHSPGDPPPFVTPTNGERGRRRARPPPRGLVAEGKGRRELCPPLRAAPAREPQPMTGGTSPPPTAPSSAPATTPAPGRNRRAA